MYTFGLQRAEVRNLWVDNATVTSNGSYSSILVGHGVGIDITNCKVTNSTLNCRVQGGGLLGAGEAHITDSSFSGTINTTRGDGWIGGIIGSQQSGTIRNCQAVGTINVVDDEGHLTPKIDDIEIGGIAGRQIFGHDTAAISRKSLAGSITNCYSSVNINFSDGKHNTFPIAGNYNANFSPIDNIRHALARAASYGNTWDKDVSPVDEYKLIDTTPTDSGRTIPFGLAPQVAVGPLPRTSLDETVVITGIADESGNPVSKLTDTSTIRLIGQNLDKLEDVCFYNQSTSQTYKYTNVGSITAECTVIKNSA